jgi:hypothetical protein
MSVNSGKEVASSGSLTHSTPRILRYQPTRIDTACHYAVGSFIAAGAAFVAVNSSAVAASADDLGGLGDITNSDFDLPDGSGDVGSTVALANSDFAPSEVVVAAMPTVPSIPEASVIASSVPTDSRLPVSLDDPATSLRGGQQATWDDPPSTTEPMDDEETAIVPNQPGSVAEEPALTPQEQEIVSAEFASMNAQIATDPPEPLVNELIDQLGGATTPTLSSDVSSGASGDVMPSVTITSGEVPQDQSGVPLSFFDQALPTDPTDDQRLIYSPYDQWLADYRQPPAPVSDSVATAGTAVSGSVSPELSAEIERLAQKNRDIGGFLSQAPDALANLPGGRESTVTPVSTMPSDVPTLPVGQAPITMEQGQKLLDDRLSIVQGPPSPAAPLSPDNGTTTEDFGSELLVGGLAANAVRIAGAGAFALDGPATQAGTALGEKGGALVTLIPEKGGALVRAGGDLAKSGAVKVAELTWLGLGLGNASGIEPLLPLVTPPPITQPGGTAPVSAPPGALAPVTQGNLGLRGNPGSTGGGGQVGPIPAPPGPKLPKVPKPPNAIKRDASAGERKLSDLMENLREPVPAYPEVPDPWGGETAPSTIPEADQPVRPVPPGGLERFLDNQYERNNPTTRERDALPSDEG